MAKFLDSRYFPVCFAAILILSASSVWLEVDCFTMKGNCSLCEVPKHHDHKETLEKLKPLCGLRFTTSDASGDYKYNIGICTAAEIAENEGALKDAGAIQVDPKSSEVKKTMIGSLKKTEVMSGRNWISLEYEGGDIYGSHCAFEERRTIVMITCSPGVTKGNLRWVEENRNKSDDCYYLFELEHDSACNLLSTDNAGLGPGSIVCIVLGTVISAYLVFGFLFMRFVKGAKGIYQIPNYDFWQDFGNLQADGCDLICRCTGKRHQELKAPYHGIGDSQIESANDGEDLDEHLLPM